MSFSRNVATASLVLALTGASAAFAAPPIATLTMPSPPFTATPTSVLTWSWGATNPLDLGSGGAGAGKVVLQSLTITRNSDSQSPAFFSALATGATLSQVVLATPSVSVTLRPVIITGYKSDLGEGDKTPVETITMSYGAISNYSVSGACAGSC